MELSNLKKMNLKEWITEQKKKQIPSDVYPTDYKISTITTNCRLFFMKDGNMHPIFINYLSFFNMCDLSEEDIVFKKYRFKAQRWNWGEMREYSKPTQKMLRKNSKMKGVFYNQVTLEIYSKYSNKVITTFLYDNGSMNNTGNKHIEDTNNICESLVKTLKLCHSKKNIMYHYQNVNLSNWDETNSDLLETHLNETLVPLDLSEGDIVMRNLNISTMNAKYNVGIKINRDNLLSIIKRMNEVDKNSDIYLALLETSNYAGLNIKVRWRNDCHEKVHIKQKKKWKCRCSDITILVFQSGEVMISGSKTIEQLDYVKDIFDKLIKSNIEEVIDIDLNSIISIPNQKRIKRIHKYFSTKEIGDKTFLLVSSDDTTTV